MVTESLARAFASTRAVLTNVSSGDLGASTPCEPWNLAQLSVGSTAGATSADKLASFLGRQGRHLRCS